MFFLHHSQAPTLLNGIDALARESIIVSVQSPSLEKRG
jgi:hypothetical protein